VNGVLDMVFHRPVMVDQVLELLRPRAGGCYVDATVGEGGHAEAILEASGPTGRLIGIDRDESILACAADRLAPFDSRVSLHHGDYRRLEELLRSIGMERVDGILIDLGISSYHFDRPERGFSFRFDGPLDMRIDQSQEETAADLLCRRSESELCALIEQLGEERWAHRIARAIATQQRVAPITSTGQLASVIERAVPPSARYGRLHPATRTFQALRITLNRELEGLEGALEAAVRCLVPGGRLCVLTFHSLEDRIVKWQFRAMSAKTQAGGAPVVELLTKRPLRPVESDLDQNPRARSAKLRAVVRVSG
jgi:16S rRNA (cytosine1402-N4)-methyltransferase